MTLKRLEPYMNGLASLYPVRIAVNSPNLQPATHIVFLDKKASGWLNAHSSKLVRNSTKIICRTNSTHLLNPELQPLIKYPFTTSETVNPEYDPQLNPRLYTNALSFMTALNIAVLENCTNAIVVGCSLTQTGHYDSPKNVFWANRSHNMPRKLKRINDSLPHIRKFLNLYQYTELESNLDLPNISFKQLMTKNF